METRLLPAIASTPDGREAEAILRACVHCGFCTATCPTYQLLGDELDGPRGRIYLIKQALEGAEVTARTQLHLDRCLTADFCRGCFSAAHSRSAAGRSHSCRAGLQHRYPKLEAPANGRCHGMRARC
jgi:glycolate oxidase iron-sulfur subunit